MPAQIPWTPPGIALPLASLMGAQQHHWSALFGYGECRQLGGLRSFEEVLEIAVFGKDVVRALSTTSSADA